MNAAPQPVLSLTEILHALVLALIAFFDTCLADLTKSGKGKTLEARRLALSIRGLRLAAAHLGPRLGTPDAATATPVAPRAPHPRRAPRRAQACTPILARPGTRAHRRIAGPAHAAIAFQARRPGTPPAPARTLEL